MSHLKHCHKHARAKSNLNCWNARKMPGSWAECYTLNMFMFMQLCQQKGAGSWGQVRLSFSQILTSTAKPWVRNLCWAWLQEALIPPAGFKYLMVPVGEGRGLIRWAMLSGMFIVKGEIWGCTGFTGDSGASCFSLFSLDRAVNVILMFVLGNLKVQLKNKNKQTNVWVICLQNVRLSE